MPQKKKKVLFVDDDPQFLQTVQGLMHSFAAGAWEISIAHNAGEALAILQDHQIDLVVLDVHMPVVDGMQFLSLLSRKHPNLMKVVLTGDGSEIHRASCLSRGAELFLEKPQHEGGWRSVYHALNELTRFQPEEGFRGVLRRVGLQDVLQMECLSRHSALLEIATREAHGQIYISDGQIIHAQAGQRSGEDAFNYLMSLTGGEFHLKPFVEPAQRTITGSWEFLLMEAARMRDEAGAPEIASGSEAASNPVANATAFTGMPQGTQFLQKVVQPTKSDDNTKPQIAEILVSSPQGDVLYQWQCDDANARINFLEFLSQKARQLSSGLPMGPFERLEVQGSKSRMITQLENDHAIFVRTNLTPQPSAGYNPTR
jgi:CheY-like chemotaxis protein